MSGSKFNLGGSPLTPSPKQNTGGLDLLNPLAPSTSGGSPGGVESMAISKI